MKRLYLLTCMALAAQSAACGALPRGEDERAAILELYEAQRASHFAGDADLFLAAVDTGYLAIGSGAVRYQRKSDALRSVGDYFQQTRFDELRDVSPPRVIVSPDGRNAWLIGEIEVRGSRRDSSGAGRPFAFRAAWMDAYERGGDGWRLVARANTQRDLP